MGAPGGHPKPPHRGGGEPRGGRQHHPPYHQQHHQGPPPSGPAARTEEKISDSEVSRPTSAPSVPLRWRRLPTLGVRVCFFFFFPPPAAAQASILLPAGSAPAHAREGGAAGRPAGRRGEQFARDWFPAGGPPPPLAWRWGCQSPGTVPVRCGARGESFSAVPGPGSSLSSLWLTSASVVD